MLELLRNDIIRFRQFNYFKQCRRTIFSQTKQWHVTCTFDDNCFSDLMKRFEAHWKPVLEKEWDKYCDANLNKKPDRCILSMFPYPSGSLHLGHSRLFTTSDILTRYSMMNNKTVIHPLGWDSFGLPAENAAIQNSLDPNSWTTRNIQLMKDQLRSLGLNFNFREATSDPSFYRWTQWLFLQLYEHKLAYKSLSYVNWDPVDCTVLANEQIDENGLSWRSGAKVEKRLMKQWFIKTSALIDELYRSEHVDLKKLGWSQLIRTQRSWFQQPNTYLFYLNLEGNLILPVITERPETFFQADCEIEVSKDHWIASLNNFQIANPFVNRQISIKVTDKPEGSVFAKLVSNREVENDERLRSKIFEICKENTSLGGYFVPDSFHDWLVSRQRYWGTPIPIVDCKRCGLQPVDSIDLPVELPRLSNYLKSNAETDAGQMSSPKKSRKKGSSTKVINKLTELAPKEWIFCKCPKCNGSARRETDTLDTFVDSSWYFLRYFSEPKSQLPFDPRNCQDPVWLYLGGSEHCKGHMFYSRFIYSFLRKKGLLKSEHAEPFDKILFLGMVNGKTYNYKGKYLTEEQVDRLVEQENVDKKKIQFKFEKMSKSKMNGVSPEHLVSKHGCDITRYCVLGYTGSQKTRNWKGEKDEFNEGMRTLRKFILTVDQFIYMKRLQSERPSAPIVRIYTKQKLTEDLDVVCRHLRESRNEFLREITIFFNQHKPGKASKILQNYIKALRKYVLTDEVIQTAEFERALADLVILFSPFTPHVSEELWSGLAHFSAHLKNDPNYSLDKYCFEQNWPQLDDDFNYRIDLVLFGPKRKSHLKSISVPRERIVKSNRDELYRLADGELQKLALKPKHTKELHIHERISAQFEVKLSNYKEDEDD